MDYRLNESAYEHFKSLLKSFPNLRVDVHHFEGGGQFVDFGIKAQGGLAAGLELAKTSLAGLAEVKFVPGKLLNHPWLYVYVQTDHPLAACLLSQYAGWQIQQDKFFAMGSGPIRILAAQEELYQKIGYQEQATHCIGILETSQIPDQELILYLSEKTNMLPEQISLLGASTSSRAGTVQVVARSLETALHKLFELDFDLKRIQAGWGVAPLAPFAPDDLTAIGWTNDAILYGSQVTLWVQGDDQSLTEIGPQIPAQASACYGKPFLEIFKEAGHDFYQIDPLLFSPAEVIIQNIDTGNSFRFGETAENILKRSYKI